MRIEKINHAVLASTNSNFAPYFLWGFAVGAQLFVDPVPNSFLLDFLQILDAVKLYYARIACQQIAWETGTFTAQIKPLLVTALTNLTPVILRIRCNIRFAS